MREVYATYVQSFFSVNAEIPLLPPTGLREQLHYKVGTTKMSNVNYSLKNKGVRLIDTQDAWVKGKNGKQRLNPDFHFVGKMSTTMPNMIVSASDKKKPTYKGNTCDLNATAKCQIVSHFYDDMKVARTSLLQSFNHCPQGRGRVEVGGNDVRRREFNVKSVADFGDDFHYIEGVENAVVDEFRFIFEVDIGSDFAEYFK